MLSLLTYLAILILLSVFNMISIGLILNISIIYLYFRRYLKGLPIENFTFIVLILTIANLLTLLIGLPLLLSHETSFSQVKFIGQPIQDFLRPFQNKYQTWYCRVCYFLLGIGKYGIHVCVIYMSVLSFWGLLIDFCFKIF